MISGTAEWTVGANGYEQASPGACIHHPAWVPHGRRMRRDVFLGAWRWSGELDLNTFRLEATDS